MSGRHFRRLCDRYEEDGSEGLRDRRFGEVSPRRGPARERMQALYRERYIDNLGFHPQRHRKEAAAKGIATKRERGELKEAAAKGAATRKR